MNYDAQQYPYSHGLVTAPQLHLQQQLMLQNQFQQQQQIFQQQQQNSQAAVSPASNVYQFQFTGAGSPVNHIFQQKNVHHVGIVGGLQPTMAPQCMAPQPFIKQGVSVGVDLVGGLDSLMYTQQKSNVKIIANSDGRIIQQPEDVMRMQHNFVGAETMRSSNFIDQNLTTNLQHHGIKVAGQSDVFTYNKQQFPSWLNPQQISNPPSGCNSSLPALNNTWSQFEHQKLADISHTQHLNQFQQQFHNQFNVQQFQVPTQHHFTSPNFQTMPSIQKINVKQPQKLHHGTKTQHTVSHLPQVLNCFSPSQAKLISPKEIQNTKKEIASVERCMPISLQSPSPLSLTKSPSSCIDQRQLTAASYVTLEPPKVTVTLDSLANSDTFPPNHVPNRPEVSFNSHDASAHFIKAKAVKNSTSITSSLLTENFHSQPYQEWQISQKQSNICYPKPLMHTSSTGSSLERSSSENSNFSSPPYVYTPPGSSDSMFSPALTQFSKTPTEGSLSGRTSELSSSSSTLSVSPPVTICIQPQPPYLSTSSTVPAVTTAFLIASSTCTTTTSTNVSCCSSIAISTTSVISTISSSKESTRTVSTHSGISSKSDNNCQSGRLYQPCNPGKSSVSVPYCWQRKFENGVIVYLSPSGAVLQSLDQICHYLLSDSTCKCGLECPIQLEKFFSFDPDVTSQPWSGTSSNRDNLANLCNHQREILSLAAFHSSKSEPAVNLFEPGMWLGGKRLRKKSSSAMDGLIVSPLKRLKTSITKAVNKHAQSIGHRTPQTPHASAFTVDKQIPVLDKEICPSPGQGMLLSPVCSVETPESCAVHCSPSSQASPISELGKSDFQKVYSCHGGDNRDLASCIRMENLVKHEQSNYLPSDEEGQEGVPGQHGSIRTQNFVPVVDNHILHQREERELVMSLQSQYSGPCNNPITQLHPQGRSHNQEPTKTCLHLTNNHFYHPDMAQQGCCTAGWHGDCPDPNFQPHHHISRSYQSDLNFQSSNFNNPLVQNNLGNQSHLGCTKTKNKHPKSKKDKQKQTNTIVDRSSPCLKAQTKPATVPSTTASFFGNPIVFVQQQTALIKSSIALCQITCSSPPPQNTSKQLVAHSPLNENVAKLHKDNKSVTKDCPEVFSKDKSMNEGEKEEKTGTDLDSNKSFSDTTENNDSAYLSQNGSDQERSDIIDSLDSSSEIKLNSSDVYTFNALEELEKKNNGRKPLDVKLSGAKNLPVQKNSKKQQHHVLPGKVSNLASKCLEGKKVNKSKVRQKTITAKKDSCLTDSEAIKKYMPGNLTSDLSQLLASNNWNIPALQQFLAQYNSRDPGQLKAILQQLQSKSVTDSNFPASSLLSAAARAQINVKKVTPSFSSGKKVVMKNSNMEVLPVINGSSVADVKTGVASAVCGTVANSTVVAQQLQQPQPTFHQVAGSTSLVGSMMQLQQFPTGSIAMSMLFPATGQGNMYTSDPLGCGDMDMMDGQRINPLMASGMLAAVSQTGDIGSHIKLSVPSVILPSLGPNVTPCMPDSNTVLLNSFTPGVIMNTPMPPVSVSVVTNVTNSLAQVLPTVGINQTIFGPHQVTPQLLGSHQNTAQVINTGTSIPGPQLINTSSLINPTPPGTQFITPATQRTQLLNNTSQAAQFMNTLSVQGLNKQLLITNPIQQISPSNSIPQLSPAMAAHIITPGNPQLPQMSPSYLNSQIQKHTQNTLINSQSVFASASLPALTVTSDSVDVIAGSMFPGSIISSNIKKNVQVCESLDKLDITNNNISDMKKISPSIASSSVYATANQPVFVIPQPNANSLMQMLGQMQPLAPADLNNTSQGNPPQLIGHSTTFDQSLIQNLLATGFNPLSMQQVMNTVNMNGAQQQQQLLMLQLQQLMLQQSQNMPGMSPPLSSNPSQAAALGVPTIVGSVLPQPGLQLNPVMDINTLYPCLSPVTQRYQNQLSPVTAAPIQHVPSAMTIHQVTHVNPYAAVSLGHTNGSVQNLMQFPGKHLQTGHTLLQQQLPPDQFPCGSYENMLRLQSCNNNGNRPMT